VRRHRAHLLATPKRLAFTVSLDTFLELAALPVSAPCDLPLNHLYMVAKRQGFACHILIGFRDMF